MPIRTRVTRVTVNDSEISDAFKSQHGSVRQNMERMAVFHLAITQKVAPKRTSNMAAMISWAVRPAFSKYKFMYTIDNHADYAIYTLQGTTGPIVSSQGPIKVSTSGDLTGWRAHPLAIRPSPHSRFPGPGSTPLSSVRGQKGKDWMGFATKVAMQKFTESI